LLGSVAESPHGFSGATVAPQAFKIALYSATSSWQNRRCTCLIYWKDTQLLLFWVSAAINL